MTMASSVAADTRCPNGVTFGAATAAAETGSNPRAVVGADLNADGRTDLVVTNLDGNSVSVLLGAGDGTFAPIREYPTSAPPVAVTATDINGDGRADLLTSVPGPGAVEVFTAGASGDFGGAAEVVLGAGAYDALASRTPTAASKVSYRPPRLNSTTPSGLSQYSEHRKTRLWP